MVQRENDLLGFNSELQNEPLNPNECLFKLDEYSHWTDQYRTLDEFLQTRGEYLEFYAACDPGLGKDQMRGDYTAIVILARDRKDKTLSVVIADIQRYEPTETIDALFAYYQRFKFVRLAIETNQFQDLLAQGIIVFIGLTHVVEVNLHDDLLIHNDCRAVSCTHRPEYKTP